MQASGIETDVVMLTIMLHKQFLELTKNHAGTFHINGRFQILTAQGIGHLQEDETAQVTDNAITIKGEMLQMVGKQRQGLGQVFCSRRFKDKHRQTKTQQPRHLIIKGLSVRQTVKIIGSHIKHTHPEIGTQLFKHALHARSQHNQMPSPNLIMPIGIIQTGCSVCDEQKEKTFSNSYRPIGRKRTVHNAATRLSGTDSPRPDRFK